MILVFVLICAFIIYLINKKKFIGKTNAQKIWGFGIYALSVFVGIFIFFEILHIIKYHSIN
jgi:predicted membrane channel-forming protein YqfA (hemolysin III family)